MSLNCGELVLRLAHLGANLKMRSQPISRPCEHRTKEGDSLTWTQVVNVCNQAELRVLGEAEVDRARPWLEGHWEELKQLDTNVALVLKGTGR
jgi:hypothetical protein